MRRELNKRISALEKRSPHDDPFARPMLVIEEGEDEQAARERFEREHGGPPVLVIRPYADSP